VFLPPRDYQPEEADDLAGANAGINTSFDWPARPSLARLSGAHGLDLEETWLILNFFPTFL
jgi:hypothetical protein